MKQALVKVARPAMGSLFEIYAGGGDPEGLERLGLEALDRVDWLEQQLSHYLPDSDISRINARAYHEPVVVQTGLFHLLARLRQSSVETEGAFDCTAGRLVREWGFFRRGALQGEEVRPPAPERIATITQQIGWRNVELNEVAQTIQFLTPYVELHLGAVGKGYIVQCAAEFLRESGVTCALLHSGNSSIVALGAPPEETGWPVGVGETTVQLRDATLSTSGGAEQFVMVNGIRFGHLFDPRTGQPVERNGSVTVCAPDATDGDALATAFFVQGEDWTRAYCATHPEIQAWFVEP